MNATMISKRKKREALHDESIPEPTPIQFASIQEHIHFRANR